MAAPGPSLSRPEPTAEDLDRFASEIKASWELDDAPFTAGPAPSPADLAALNPASNGARVEPAAVKFEAPKPAAPAAAAPVAALAPAAAAQPAARPAAGPSGTVLIPRTELNSARPPPPAPAPIRTPSYGTPLASSPELLTGSFAVPKRRTGVYVGIGLVVAVVAVGGLMAMKGGGVDESKASPIPAKTAETPRDNPIPPPPPVEEVEAKKAATPPPTKAAAKPEPEPAPAKVEPAPPPSKPEPRVAAKAPERAAPEPRPAPRPVAAARPEPRPAPAPAAPKPAAKPGGGGIVRDVPF